jgi:hypothetical protein
MSDDTCPESLTLRHLRALDTRLEQIASDMARGFTTVTGHLIALTGRIYHVSRATNERPATVRRVVQQLLRPRDFDPLMRNAGGTWDPGARRWLVEQRRISRSSAPCGAPWPEAHRAPTSGSSPPAGRPSSRNGSGPSSRRRSGVAMRPLTPPKPLSAPSTDPEGRGQPVPELAPNPTAELW